MLNTKCAVCKILIFHCLYSRLRYKISGCNNDVPYTLYTPTNAVYDFLLC
jgi:hypothetical protein